MEITGRKVSFTDLWGLIVEYFLQEKVKIHVWMCTAVSFKWELYQPMYLESRNQILSTFVQAVLWNKHSIFFSKEFLIHTDQCYRKIQCLFGMTVVKRIAFILMFIFSM